MNFKDKYIKYKSKYINLKNKLLYGGGNNDNKNFDQGKIILESDSFNHYDLIPDKYTCDSENKNGISPHIKWSNLPEETQSLVLIMEDPDAPNGIFDHWIVWNIDPNKEFLEEDYKPTMGVRFGLNSFGNTNYGGPCPPKGERHQYIFKLYALSSTLSINNANKQMILDSINNIILDTGTLIGLYERD